MIQPFDYSQAFPELDRVGQLIDEERKIVDFYESSLRSVAEKPIAPTLESLKRSHQRNASQLQYSVYVQGGAPHSRASSADRARSERPVVRDVGSLARQAIERELECQSRYESAMAEGGVAEPIRELIERDLLPRVAANATVLMLVESRVWR